MKINHKTRYVQQTLFTSILPFMWHLVGLILISIVWAADQSIRPYLIKLLLDSIAKINLMPHNPLVVMERIILLSSIYIGTGGFVVFSFRVYDWISMCMMPALKKKLAEQLSEHLMLHDYRFYQNTMAGGLASKLNDVANGVPELIEICIERFWGSFLALCIAIITMSTVALSFAVAAIVWITLFMIGGLLIGRKQHQLSNTTAHAWSVVIGNTVDVCSHMNLVQLFGGRKHEMGRLSKLLTSWVLSENKRAWSALGLYIFQGFSFLIFEAVCLILLIRGVEKGAVTGGDFALIFSLNVSMIYTLWRLSQDMTRFSKALGAVTQGITCLIVPPALTDKAHAHCLVVLHGAIDFDNVSFHHDEDDDKELFENLSLHIPAQQKVGLVGFSGSGKSTFVNLLLRLFDPQQGKICIDGQNIADVTQASVRHAISLIPQDGSLLHRPIKENIRYSNFDATDEEVIEAAKKSHAHEFILQLPHGYDTVVGERGLKLSGGQRQRIAIARAFVKKSHIVILDEATSSLDSVTESNIQNSITMLTQGRTTLIIAHRLATLVNMERILVFDHGTIVEDGTHEKLLNQDGIYRQLWQAQVCGLLPDQCLTK